MKDETEKITDLSFAVIGSNLDDLPHRVVLEHTTVRKHRVRLQIVKMIVREYFSLESL